MVVLVVDSNYEHSTCIRCGASYLRRRTPGITFAAILLDVGPPGRAG